MSARNFLRKAPSRFFLGAENPPPPQRLGALARAALFFCLLSAAALSPKAKAAADSGKKSAENISRDYLIQKLEGLRMSLPAGHFSKRPLDLRLAHILSLRAEERLAGDSSSAAARRDAEKALRLYKGLAPLIKSRHPALYSRSLFEMAWLSRLMGKKAGAAALLEEAVQLAAGEKLKLRAWFNLGEIRFELHQYKEALAAFDQTLKKGKASGENIWAFRTSYRRIWCLYNLSREEEALQALLGFLKSPLYLTGARTKEEKKIKARLQGELTALYSRGEVTGPRLSFLYSFQKDSPGENTPQARRRRLADLAESLSRIGRAAASTKAYRHYLSKQPSLEEEMRAWISMIKNDFILGKEAVFNQSGPKARALFALQGRLGKPCPAALCREAKKLQKACIKAAEAKLAKAPAGGAAAAGVFSLYKSYNSFYPGEFDMLAGQAFAARRLKKFSEAADLFQKAALAPLPPESRAEGRPPAKAKKAAAEEKPAHKAAREKAAALQMEMARLSKDRAVKKGAFRFYLQHGGDKELLFRAKYQMAGILYEEERLKEAGERFLALALAAEDSPAAESGASEIKSLRLEAARRSLAALSAQKSQQSAAEARHLLIASRAGRFQSLFPKNKREFASIRHRALLNSAKALVSGKNLSPYPVQASKDKDILRAYQILGLVDPALAKEDDLKKCYMNRLILAKELLYLKDAGEIVSRLLALPSLSKEERGRALKSRLWLAEARMDFKEALKLVQELSRGDESEEHLLRLARLAELAGKDPVPHYQSFLAKRPQSEKAELAARLLIERALKGDARTKSQKAALLSQYGHYFSKQPEALSLYILRLDENRFDQKLLSRFAEKYPFLRASFAARFLKRKRFVESFLSALNKARERSLPETASERRMARALKAWGQAIERLEASAARAVELEDWLAQAVAFSGVYSETSRFYESVLALPPPQDLTLEEKAKYQSLIRDQMAPYKKRARELLAESEKLWSKKFTDRYRSAYAETDPVYQGALQWELKQLAAAAGPERAAALGKGILSESRPEKKQAFSGAPAEEKIRRARARLRASPFSGQRLEALLQLEESRGNTALALYLRGRIRQINQIKRGAL